MTSAITTLDMLEVTMGKEIAYALCGRFPIRSGLLVKLMIRPTSLHTKISLKLLEVTLRGSLYYENRTGGIFEPTKRRDRLEEGDVSRATAQTVARPGPDPSMTPNTPTPFRAFSHFYIALI